MCVKYKDYRPPLRSGWWLICFVPKQMSLSLVLQGATGAIGRWQAPFFTCKGPTLQGGPWKVSRGCGHWCFKPDESQVPPGGRIGIFAKQKFRYEQRNLKNP